MPSAHDPEILGVLNVSPESMVRESIATDPSEIRLRADALVSNGATWIDLGGRSITPDAPRVDDAEEQRRLGAALRVLGHPLDRVSVDTWSEATAVFALDAGVGAINYTGGSISSPSLERVARESALLFITFMPYQNAYTMRDAEPAAVGIQAVLDHLGPRVEAARSAGVERLVIDPNLGIIHPAADDLTKIHQQLDIVWNLEALRVLGCPILLYAARKPEPLGRMMMASAVVHARPDYIRTHTPEMIERLLHVQT